MYFLVDIRKMKSARLSQLQNEYNRRAETIANIKKEMDSIHKDIQKKTGLAEKAFRKYLIAKLNHKHIAFTFVHGKQAIHLYNLSCTNNENYLMTFEYEEFMVHNYHGALVDINDTLIGLEYPQFKKYENAEARKQPLDVIYSTHNLYTKTDYLDDLPLAITFLLCNKVTKYFCHNIQKLIAQKILF
jgi:hypothetical protein